jgi:hypothetical protein
VAKLIQICASQNDLFGLDDDGMVHQYNFNTNTWLRLGRGRSDSSGSSFVEESGWPPGTDRPMRTDSGERRT